MVMLKILGDLAGETEGRMSDYTVVAGPETEKLSGGIKRESGSCVTPIVCF